MSTTSGPRTLSRKFSNSSAPHRDDLHRSSSDKRTRHTIQQSCSYSCHARDSHKTAAASSRTKKKMGQLPQKPQGQELFYFYPNTQGLDAAPEIELASQPWMMATMIEDDDLMFGGKSLSTWYEEDRRRYSMGEESTPPSSPSSDEEEEQRGRQRDRPHFSKPPRKHHAYKPSKIEGDDKKR